MRAECVQAVTEAALRAGRTLTQQELKGIEDRVRTHLRLMAKENREAFVSLSAAGRMQEAARRASDDLLAEAIKKKQRAALTIQKRAAIDTFLQEVVGKKGSGIFGGKEIGAVEGVLRLLAFKSDASGNILSVETRARAIAEDALRLLGDVFELRDEGTMMNLFAKQETTEQFIKELWGEDSGNPLARKAAQEFQRVADMMVDQFNDAGGQIRKRKDWHIMQSHSQEKVMAAGQRAWVDNILPKLNRDEYVNLDGSLMSDAELTRFLDNAWESIASGGLTKLDANNLAAGRSGMLANRGSLERQLHFKDAASWSEYHNEFGNGSVWEMAIGHFHGIGRDVALIEALGPNPKHMLDSLLVEAEQRDFRANIKNASSQADRVRGVYEMVAGTRKPIDALWLDTFSRNFRNIQVANKMGSLLFAQFADQGTMLTTARTLNIPAVKLWIAEAAAAAPKNAETKRAMRRMAVAFDTMSTEMTRWGDEMSHSNVTSKLASTVINVSGANAMTRAERRGFAMAMYSALGDLVSKHDTVAGIIDFDNRYLAAKGITENDWAVWRLAEQQEIGGLKMLSPDAIDAIPDSALEVLGSPAKLKREARLRLIGATVEEVNMAVLTPSLETLYDIRGKIQRGTVGGVIAETFLQFKTFPWAMVRQHLHRGLSEQKTYNKVAYTATLMTTLTIFGALGLAAQDLAMGRDPRKIFDADDPTRVLKFGSQAIMKGGGLGIYGDLLFADVNSYGRGIAEVLGGPGVGFATSLWKITQGNVGQAIEGKATNIEGEMVKLFKDSVPFQNLWYTRAVTDRLIFNQLQEAANPGYARRVRKAVRNNYGSEFWWQPDEFTPERAPNLGNVVAE